METKTCTKCSATKPASGFYVNRTAPDGLQSYCKECCKAASSAVAKRLRAEVRAFRERRAPDPAWRRRCADHYAKYGYSARIYSANWHAHERGASGFLTEQDVNILYKRQEARCARCRTSLGAKRKPNGYHIDHITPVSRGGKNVPSNVQLLCPTCNVRKGARTRPEFTLYLRKVSGAS